jgi:hypothetical protein
MRTMGMVINARVTRYLRNEEDIMTTPRMNEIIQLRARIPSPSAKTNLFTKFAQVPEQ